MSFIVHRMLLNNQNRFLYYTNRASKNIQVHIFYPHYVKYQN